MTGMRIPFEASLLKVKPGQSRHANVQDDASSFFVKIPTLQKFLR